MVFAKTPRRRAAAGGCRSKYPNLQHVLLHAPLRVRAPGEAMSEAEVLWFVGKLFLCYTFGWGAGMMIHAFKRAAEQI